MSVGTDELHGRHGLTNNRLHRLVARGILRPETRPGGPGAGYAYFWDEAEQRAVAAVVELLDSRLMQGGKSGGIGGREEQREARDLALRAVADAARGPLPSYASARWLILLGDGSCIRGDDWLAAAITEPRTLIPLDPRG